MVLDVHQPLQHKRLLEYELEGFGIRLNKTPPNISFKKKDKGGLNLTSLVSTCGGGKLAFNTTEVTLAIGSSVRVGSGDCQDYSERVQDPQRRFKRCHFHITEGHGRMF